MDVPTVILSLDAKQRIGRQRFEAKHTLENRLNDLYRQQPQTFFTGQPQIENNVAAKEVIASYAVKLLEIEAAEYRPLGLSREEFAERLKQLCRNIRLEVCPPNLNCLFHLESLRYNEEFHALVWAALQSAANSLSHDGSQQQEVDAVPGESPKSVLDRYRTERRWTIKKLADHLSVDESVLYAIRRGKAKCSEGKLQCIATKIGCPVESLRNKGPGAGGRRTKSFQSGIP